MLQFLLIICGLIFVIVFMLWLNANHNPSKINTNVFSLVGKEGIVIEDINPIEATGQIKVGGERWSATCKGNNTILKKTVVKIIEVDGVKLLVEPK